MKPALKLVDLPIVNLPDGSRIFTILLLNGAGHRVGKVSGDLNSETEHDIRLRAIVRKVLFNY